MFCLSCGSSMLRWYCAAGGTEALHKNQWHHEKQTLCENIEKTSQEINQEIKDWKTGDKCFFPKGHWCKIHRSLLSFTSNVAHEE